MKILIVDKDNVAIQLIRAKLEPKGHLIFEEPNKNNAIARMGADEVDVVILDPSPLTTIRPLILNMRRSVNYYPSIILLSATIAPEEVKTTGANDLLPKPVNPALLEQKIINAERITKLVQRIGDDSEDFPSAGGVIAKSAFNQLLLSAIDRSDRYGERTFILQISLSNYQQIKEMDGAYGAEYTVAKLCQYLVLLRRQSDIIGQTEKFEYSLLMQRPVYETEPMEAANRFAEALAKYEDINSSGSTKPEITVSLLDIPAGSLLVQHVVRPGESVETQTL